MRARQLLISLLSVLTLLIFSLTGLQAAQAGKPAGSGGTTGGGIGVKLQGYDKLSNSWTPGNTAGWAEKTSIPFRLVLTGSGTLTTLQVTGDHDNGGVPGFEDLNTFRICTGAPISGQAGATGCTDLPFNAPLTAGGPYVTRDVPNPVLSGVTQVAYTFHDVDVPGDGQVLLFKGELALGSHRYPGSALHMAVGTATTADGSEISYGGKNVPIPVNGIIATETDKKINGLDTFADGTIGQVVRVSIVGTAFGPSKGTQILTIRDELPSCLSYEDNVATSTTATVTEPALHSTGTTVSATFTAVKNGTSRTLSFDAKIVQKSTACRNWGFTHSDQVPVDSSDFVDITARGIPNVTPDKECSDQVGPGETAQCTISYSNIGSETSDPGTVTDVLDPGLTFVAGTPAPASVTGTPAGGQTIVWNIPALAPGDGGSITYGETVPATGPAGTSHFADTATTHVPGDGNPGDDSDTEIVDVDYTPDLYVDKACPDNAPAGGSAVFTITFGNGGSAATGQTTVVDTLPAGLEYASATPQPDSVTNGGRTVTWIVDGVAAGSAGNTITLTAAVTGTGSFTNQVDISSALADADTSDNHAQCSTNLAYTDVGIGKDCGSGVAEPNALVTHTLTVDNSGNQPASNVVVTDTLPTGLTREGAPTYSLTGVGDPTFSQNGQQLTWTFATLPAGAGGTISYQVRVANTWETAGAQEFTDSATIATSSSNAINPSNDSDACTTTVDFQPHVTLEKTGCRLVVAPGGYQTYTLSFSNDGHAPATGLVLTDTPSGDQPIASAPGASVDGNTATWDIGTLGVGDSGNRSLIVVVNADDGTTVSNTATLTGNNAVDVSDLATTTVSAAGRHSEADGYAIGITGAVSLPVTATSRAEAPQGPNDSASAVIPSLSVPGLLTTGVLTTVSHAEVGVGSALATNSTEVVNLNMLAGQVKADVIRGYATAVAGPFGASSSSVGSSSTKLVIAGNAYDLANVAPNTVINIPLVATVRLNQVTKTASVDGDGNFVTGIDVNMIVVDTVLGARIVVGHSHAEAAYPSGLACGLAPSTVSGRAYTAHVQTSTILDLTVNDAEIAPLGGSEDANGASANVPGVLSAGAVTNHAEGSIGTSPAANARSTVAGLNLLGGMITAQSLDMRAASTASGGTAATDLTALFLNLVVNGTAYSAPLPNQVINIPQADGSLVHIVLNEQIRDGNGTTDTAGTVNAIHVQVFNAVRALTTDVVVASAHSDAHQGG